MLGGGEFGVFIILSRLVGISQDRWGAEASLKRTVGIICFPSPLWRAPAAPSMLGPATRSGPESCAALIVLLWLLVSLTMPADPCQPTL